MSIDELEKLCEQMHTTQEFNPWTSDYFRRACFIEDKDADIIEAMRIALPKLIAVARAAQGMFGPKPFISYLQTQRVVQLERNKLKEALAELEKS